MGQYFRPFLFPITISIIQIEKAQMVCQGFEPGAAGSQAQTKPRNYVPKLTQVHILLKGENCYPIDNCDDVTFTNKIVGNPIYSYQVLKRLHVYWKNMENVIKDADGKSKNNFHNQDVHFLQVEVNPPNPLHECNGGHGFDLFTSLIFNRPCLASFSFIFGFFQSNVNTILQL